MRLSQLRRIRWAVRAALVLAIAASVAANVLHAEPNPIAQTIAGWPPVALLITLELVVRIPVARRLGWLRAGATAVIAGIAAWVSYWHMAGVAARYGEEPAAAHLLPLSVDGLIVVASVSLVELAARIRETSAPEPQARPEPVGVPLGLPPRRPVVSLVKTAPAAVEVPLEVPPPPPAVDAARNGKPARPAAETRRLAQALIAGDPTLSRREIAELLGVTTRRLRDVLAAPAGEGTTG